MNEIELICHNISDSLNISVTYKPEVYELNRGNRLYVDSKKTRIFIDGEVLRLYENHNEELILTIQEYFQQHVIK